MTVAPRLPEARALLRAARARLVPRPASGIGAPDAPVVSVAIPVLNGGDRYVEVVGALAEQQVDGPVEILVADSGSTDGRTDAVAERFPQVRLFDVEPEDFNHGRVRTGLILAARAPLVAILSADAKPIGTGYLAAMLRAFEDDEVVAAHARQVPRAGADPLVVERLARWTPEGREPIVRVAPGPEGWSAASADERLAAVRLDNVASMVRREAVLRIPFPPRSFGEDLAWATLVARSGGAFAYVPDAVVEHHHDPTVAELFSRNRRSHRQVTAELGLRAVPTVSAGLRALAAETVGVANGHGAGWAARTLPRRAAALAGQWLGGREALWEGPTGPLFEAPEPAPEPEEDFSESPRPAVVMPALADSPHVPGALATLAGTAWATPVVYLVSSARPPTHEGLDVRWVRCAPAAPYARRGNLGFGAAIEDGFDRIVLLNDDVEVLGDGVARLAEALRDPTVGIAGAVLLEWEDGAVQHGGIDVTYLGRTVVRRDAPEGGPPLERAALSGAAMAVRARTWRRLGGFDEGFTHFFEDIDLCRRARRLGLRLVLVPTARVRHLGGGTRGHTEPGTARLLGRNHVRFARRLPGRGWERTLRVVTVSAAGLLWAARECGPAGIPAFLEGVREGRTA